jgi:ABC-type transport system substrate-binding protein
MLSQFFSRKILIFLLSAMIFLQGCVMLPQIPVAVQPEPVVQPVFAAPIDHQPVPSPFYGDFTLRYDPNSPLNPITAMSRDNILLSSLLYESLFVLDGNLNLVSVLAYDWYTEDGITHIIEIVPDIAISDGTTLTANDVVYSLRRAMATGRFVNRLQNIISVNATDYYTISVVLRSASNRLPVLLDVPIIKEGSSEMDVPPGSGPYLFAYGSSGATLRRFPRHRYFENLPIPSISLIYSDDGRATERFDEGVLSLIWDDPGGVFEFRLNRFHESRFYDTMQMQFVGFNTRLPALRNPDVRSAIGHSIERNFIATEIMPGQALPAPLAISPAYRLYNIGWELRGIDPFHEMSALLVRAGMAAPANPGVASDDNAVVFLTDDYNFLMYSADSGSPESFVIDFIVNSENSFKVRAAHRIAETLRNTGINVVVRELPWENFLTALHTGDFDMFYGETLVSPDFDFSPLLLPNGSLNFGGTGSDSFLPLIQNFLSASDDYSEAEAARVLVNEIRMTAPFSPILYKRHAIYTPIGAVQHATPSQSGIFLGFADWIIDRTMLG